MLKPNKPIKETVSMLKHCAAELNKTSDEMNAAFVLLDEQFKKLNLGVEAWVSTTGKDVYVGYSKVNNKWGLTIKKVTSDLAGDLTSEYWLVNDAPRSYRIMCCTAIPELMQALVSAVDAMTVTANHSAKYLNDLLVGMS